MGRQGLEVMNLCQVPLEISPVSVRLVVGRESDVRTLWRSVVSMSDDAFVYERVKH